MTTVAGWGLCYLLLLAVAAASNAVIGARQLTTAMWIVGACALFGWSLHLAAKAGRLATTSGLLLAMGIAILATAFFLYCGLTVIVMMWEFTGLGH